MFAPSLNKDAAAATAEAIRAWSDIVAAWGALAAEPRVEAATERWTALVDASSRAYLSSMRAAALSSSWTFEPSPFGLTGLFTSAGPGTAPFAAAGLETTDAKAAQAEVVRRSFQALAKPLGRADDLTQIKGVGPKMQEKLNGLGVFHFWQLASLTSATTKTLDAELAANGRVAREDWVGQAKKLAEDVAA